MITGPVDESVQKFLVFLTILVITYLAVWFMAVAMLFSLFSLVDSIKPGSAAAGAIFISTGLLPFVVAGISTWLFGSWLGRKATAFLATAAGTLFCIFAVLYVLSNATSSTVALRDRAGLRRQDAIGSMRRR